MQYEDYLQQGDLARALSSLEEQVRNNPGNKRFRLQLIELFSILGFWERGLKQADAIERMFEDLMPTVLFYRSAISCEMFREAVFRGEQEPVFIGEPEQWQALIVQTLKLVAESHFEEANVLRNQALDLAPDSTGTIDETPFSWVMDADSRIGPMLEVMINGEYRWVAFSRVKTLTKEAPTELSHRVWFPAHIEWSSGGESDVYIPTRYPGSAQRSNDLALAKQTDWDELAGQTWLGYGQREFMTDKNEFPLMDVREIVFAPTRHSDSAK